MRARTFLVHAVVIILWASFFNALPQLLTGIPLEDQLSWDAKSFVNHWHRLLDPATFTGDDTLSRTLPAREEIFLGWLAKLGQVFHLDMFQWSIYLSAGVLFLFLLGLYLVSYFATRNPGFALLITLFGIIPVKVLGGGKFGLRALGFIPQTLAFTVSLYLILLYLFAVRRGKQNFIFIFFLLCGLLANLYPALFLHMIAVFFLADWFRRNKCDRSLLASLGLAMLGAVPALLYVSTDFNHPAPLDFDILQSRYYYLMAFPLSWRSLFYLRTFLFYAFFLCFLIPRTRRLLSSEEAILLSPWIALAKASFIIISLGIVLESLPIYAKYLFSRASLWFNLSAMILTPTCLAVYFRQKQLIKPLTAALVLSGIIFLWQSDLVPIAMKLRQVYENRDDRKFFLAVVDKYKGISHPTDRVLVPSVPPDFLAEEVRTYAVRPVYVAYQDGAISILDGEKARFWSDRYQKQLELFRDGNPKRLMDFLEQEKILFSFFPVGTFPESELIRSHTVIAIGNYLVVKKES